MIVTIRNVEKTLTGGRTELVNLSFLAISENTSQDSMVYVLETNKEGMTRKVCKFYAGNFLANNRMIERSEVIRVNRLRFAFMDVSMNTDSKDQTENGFGTNIKCTMYEYRIGLTRQQRKTNTLCLQHQEKYDTWGFDCAIHRVIENYISIPDLASEETAKSLMFLLETSHADNLQYSIDLQAVQELADVTLSSMDYARWNVEEEEPFQLATEEA